MNKKNFLILVAAVFVQLTSYAQQAQFTIATLNVDGLPQKILLFSVNGDGPGADGSSRIGKYLHQKAYDIVCMQEDFNYHQVILPWLEDDYQLDSHAGRVDYDVKDANIDLRYPQNIKFPSDGLGCAVKNSIQVSSIERVPWQKSFGKFSHDFDDMVTKGFRRYELLLPSGNSILVYNMHMDASSNEDEQAGRDAKDKEARIAQWLQLKEDIQSHLNGTPIIVVGDLNTYYQRDDVKAQFIDALMADGQVTVSDAWVETQLKGKYPTYGESQPQEGEMLDKIIYINPADGKQLRLVSCQVDSVDYKYQDKPLGDHFPVVATFTIGTERNATGIDNRTAAGNEAVATWYNMNGQRISAPAKGLFIEQKGNNTIKRMKP